MVRDDGPHNRVLGDADGALVDLHAFDDSMTVVDSAGVARFGPDGLDYETAAFDGTGVIAGRKVACIGADFQMRSHSGYEDDDWHDVQLLHHRFGLPIPPDYVGFDHTGLNTG